MRPRLKPRASDISKFFSYIKDEFLSDKQEVIGNVLERLLTQTSVTSVTSTDQGQTILPERQGAYKRRYLEGFDAFRLDNEQNNKNFTESGIKLLEVIYQDVKSTLEEVEFSFHGAVTASIEKRRLFKIYLDSRKINKGKCIILLIKHWKHDYRVPKFKDIETGMVRNYVIGKGSSAHDSHMYNIHMPNLEMYELNKNVFIELVKESYEMASTEYNALLKISEGSGKFQNKEFDIVAGDFKKKTAKRKDFEKLALKYLAPDYTYDV